METEVPADYGNTKGQKKTDFSLIVATQADISGCSDEFLQGVAKHKLWHIEGRNTPEGGKVAFIWKKWLVWSR